MKRVKNLKVIGEIAAVVGVLALFAGNYNGLFAFLVAPCLAIMMFTKIEIDKLKDEEVTNK